MEAGPSSGVSQRHIYGVLFDTEMPFSEYFGFVRSLSFHPWSVPILDLVLLFSEGQAGESW